MLFLGKDHFIGIGHYKNGFAYSVFWYAFTSENDFQLTHLSREFCFNRDKTLFEIEMQFDVNNGLKLNCPKIIFPMSLYLEDAIVHLTMGENDCRSILGKVHSTDIIANLYEISHQD